MFRLSISNNRFVLVRETAKEALRWLLTSYKGYKESTYVRPWRSRVLFVVGKSELTVRAGNDVTSRPT